MNPTSNVYGISLLPHFDGSVYGLKHMVEVMDSVGLVTVAKCSTALTKALYPSGVKVRTTCGYRRALLVAKADPASLLTAAKLARLQGEHVCSCALPDCISWHCLLVRGATGSDSECRHYHSGSRLREGCRSVHEANKGEEERRSGDEELWSGATTEASINTFTRRPSTILLPSILIQSFADGAFRR